MAYPPGAAPETVVTSTFRLGWTGNTLPVSSPREALDAGVGARRADADAAAALAGAGAGARLMWGDLAHLLLHGAHHTGPDDLIHVVERACARVGLREVNVHLADLEQEWLRPLLREGAPLDVDASAAGECYQRERVVTEPAAAPGEVVLWVPLLDGIERLGVLRIVAPDTPEHRWVVTNLAALVAELLVSKDQYGDVFRLAQRTRPMALESELRWKLLPPLSTTGPRAVLAAALAPAYGVAGDAFDYAWLADRLHLALFDAVGHDLHATRVANLALASYRHSRGLGRDLPDTYAAIGTDLARLYPFGDFVTGQLAELDTGSGRLTWLSAGHPRPLLVREGHHVGDLYCPASTPFGVGTGPTAVVTAELAPHDHVVFFSDGIVEARTASGEELGSAGLGAMLEDVMVEPLPAAEIVRRVMRDIRRTCTLRDDAMLVLLHWTGDG